jgi:transcriptional/translational regulatory protein YebC/TACO1
LYPVARFNISRLNGSLAANGSVAYMFKRKGEFKLPAGAVTHAQESELGFIDYELEDKEIGAASAELHYLPTITKELSEEHAKEVLRKFVADRIRLLPPVLPRDHLPQEPDRNKLNADNDEEETNQEEGPVAE